MNSLHFSIHWLKGSEAAPAEVISIHWDSFPRPDDGAAPQWRYYLRIRSAKVPITDSLGIEVLSRDGNILTRFVSGMERASPLD
jgi:hypothetical protein